jgi:hypothetical protein
MCLNAGKLAGWGVWGLKHENRRPMKGQHLPYIICRRNHVSKPHVRGERRLVVVLVLVLVVMVVVVWVVLSGRAVRLDVRSDNTGRRVARASSWILDVTRLRAH